MPTSLPHLFKFSFIWILLFISSNAKANGDDNASKRHHCLNLGAIVDYNSHSGKEERVAMEIAINDFYARLSDCDRPTLHIRDSRQDPFQAASSAKTLIKKHHVRAILGMEKWEEAALIAELGTKTKVPILSFANEIPDWACQRWPFLVNAARSQTAQMKAVAAIVQTWQWRRVTVIYEDIHSSIAGIIPYLTAAVKEVGSEIHELLALPPLPSNYSLSDKLESLKISQCRVFIVHTSLRLATNLFIKAKSMGMMGEEFVWITTTEITNQVNSLNASVISSMQGVLGVKTYVSRTGIRYEDFRSKFKVMFKLQYPKETYQEPGIFALQAYDALWVLALAMEDKTNTKNFSNSKDIIYPIKSVMGHQLLERILESHFEGLTGQFHFVNGMLAPANIFRIVNVVGKSYREVGYWSEGLGFSDHIGDGTKYYYKSMKVLGQVFWPGGPWSVPRGWALPTSTKPLIIGVPASATFAEFVEVKNNYSSNDFIVSGFSIDVFKATLEHLPYNLPYKFVPFNGSYDKLVQQVQAKTFDAVVGDTSIVSNRYAFADFSQPYADSGLQMLVYVKHEQPGKAWLFKKPFTTAMWALTGAINVYNGFVVWLIERKHNRGFRGTCWNQIGTMISLSFVTLFTLQGAKLHSNLSRMAMIVWLFVALIITQSYTASLTSLLTLQGLNPVKVNVETLRKSGAKVGCNRNSFVVNYLEVVLGFDPNNIKQVYSEEDYSRALINKEIAAAFIEVPYVKVFLAQNCKGFATSGPTYKVGGFGFVFPKGAPILSDISEAVVKVSEKGKLRDLEASLLSSYNCSATNSDDDHSSLGIGSFLGLFVITFGTSTIAFLLFILRRACQIWTIRGMLLEMKNNLTSMFRALKQINY